MRAFVLLLATLTPAGLFAQASPTNLDFEAAGQLGATPPGWTTFAVPAGLAFRTVLVSSGCAQGQQCALMSGPANAPSTAFGDVSQAIPAAPYAAHNLLFRMAVRVEDATTRAVLWLRVDRRDGTMAFLVNSPDITSNQWQYYQVSAPIAADGALIYFGVLNYGSSNVWVDDASLATLQDSVPEDH
jgi:hypothetical protein